MKLSIINVTLNDAKQLNKTLSSLSLQTWDDFELLIIDGASKDNTKEIVDSYSSKLKHLIFVSNPDNGIYSAMNQGVSLATGDYILFLNSGDTLFDNDTLSCVVENNAWGEYDILWGDKWDCKKGITKQKARINHFFFFREHIICHQTIFAKKKCLSSFPFITSWIYGADRNWLVQSYRNHFTFHYLAFPIARYDLSGLTSRPENEFAVWRESIHILSQYYGFLFTPFAYLKRIVLKTIPLNIHQKFKTARWLLKCASLKILQKAYYPGTRYYCTCCSRHLRSFMNYDYKCVYSLDASLCKKTYKHVQCPYCDSLPRHRIMAEYLLQNVDDIKDKTIIIFGMLKGEQLFFQTHSLSYLYVDLLNPSATRKEDLQNLTFTDSSVDILICNHILEHVDHLQIALSEIRRVLSADGFAIITVPLLLSQDTTLESDKILSETECKRMYGQTDHKRLFGADFRFILEQAGFIVTIIDGSSYPPEIAPVIGPATTDANLLFICHK